MALRSWCVMIPSLDHRTTLGASGPPGRLLAQGGAGERERGGTARDVRGEPRGTERLVKTRKAGGRERTDARLDCGGDPDGCGRDEERAEAALVGRSEEAADAREQTDEVRGVPSAGERESVGGGAEEGPHERACEGGGAPAEP